MRRLVTLVACLSAGPLWAGMPTFIANGGTNVNGNVGNCTPAMPGSILANDILIAVACGEGDDDGVGIALTTANGFALVMGETVGDDADATEEDPELNCEVYWKRAVGADSAPVFTDSGDHTSCSVHQFRGVKLTGNPWNVSVGSNDSNANDTSAVIPGSTTSAADCLVVLIQGTSNNGNSAANCGAVTNTDLATITEVFDGSITTGLGSGVCIITGEKASAGAYGTSTLTMANTTYKSAYSLALEGAVATGCGTTIPLTGAGCK